MGVLGLMQAHAASMPASAAARVARLRELLDAVQAEQDAWSTDMREQKEAFGARESSFAAGLEVYRSYWKWAKVIAQDGDGDALIGLLDRCPAPSDLTAATAFLAFNELANGVEAHADLFTSFEVDVAKAAELRAHSQALFAAADGLTAARRERGEASGQRESARAELVAHLRQLEKYLPLTLPPRGLDGLETLRNQFLPRYAKKTKDGPVEPAGG